MAYAFTSGGNSSLAPRTNIAVASVTSSHAYQAFQILRVVFAVAPVIAGLDKFFNTLVNWDIYLAPAIANATSIGAHSFMLVVGIVEIVAGVLVAIWPRVGGYVMAGWLAGIVINLLMIPGYFDIALRDLGLALAALALARLSHEFGA